jgi:hypothetical protein
MVAPGGETCESVGLENQCGIQVVGRLRSFARLSRTPPQISVPEPKRLERIEPDFESVLRSDAQGFVWDDNTFVPFCVKSKRTSQSLATAWSAIFAGAKSQRLAA